MLTGNPFFKRTLFPLTRGRGVVGMLFLLGLLLRWCVAEPPALAGIGFFVAAAATFFNTWRTLDDDHSSGTLEHLAVLPVSRRLISVSVGAGIAAGYCVLALIPILVGSSHGRYPVEPGQLLAGIVCTCAAALLGTLPPLRHGMDRGARAVALLLGCAGAWAAFQALDRPELRHIAPLTLGLVASCLACAYWILGWAVAERLGGSWSGGTASNPARVAPGAAATMRLTPDWAPTLLWREVTTGLPWLAALFTAGLAYILYVFATRSPPHYAWSGPVHDAAMVLPWLALYVSAASAQRTSRDRLDGMWQDLAPTPLSRRAIFWSRILGITLQVGAVGIGWGLAVLALAHGTTEVLGPAYAFLAVPFLLCPVIAMTGFVSGTAARGFFASMGGLVLVYLLLMLSYFPAVLIPVVLHNTLGREAATSPSSLVSASVCGVVFFFGSLIWSAMRGIRKTVEHDAV